MADGVLHVGPRPTFPGAEGTIELHVFDFDGDLYGREISVSFCARLRDIARFDTVPSLVTAMAADARAARAALDAGACGQGGPEVTMNG
jgi:riboflavin kinase/FMN adenylyltransferase